MVLFAQGHIICTAVVNISQNKHIFLDTMRGHGPYIIKNQKHNLIGMKYYMRTTFLVMFIYTRALCVLSILNYMLLMTHAFTPNYIFLVCIITFNHTFVLV